MIPRYSMPELSSIWTDEARFDLWLKIELLVCEAWAKEGKISKQDLHTIQSKAKYNTEQIAQIENEVKHDVIAFLTSVAEHVGPASRYIHRGMTSSDLIDTAFSCQLVQAGKIIKKDIEDLIKVLGERAKEFKNTPMMGRSHGIHAEPITFGLKLALWFDEFIRHLSRLEKAIDEISVGKISGAVGTFAHLPCKIESYVCKKLELKVAPVSNQIIQRDRHAYYFSVLAGIASSIEKIALEIRHLQRTEVFEAAEPFSKGQKGSSAMPHKRNPILCENLCGLARIVRANAQAGFENIALWHERDISHSSVERVIAPDSTILTDFMLARITSVIKGLDVFPENMKKNLELTKGLYASQDLLLKLTDAGMLREDAYRIVQNAAMIAWKDKESLKKIVLEDSNISKFLDKNQIEEIFNIDSHLVRIEEIFKRVGLD